MRSDGRTPPSAAQRLLWRAQFALRQALVKRVDVDAGADRYTFRCKEYAEVYRAVTLFVKEERTAEWIQAEAAPGDVFYDIGANTGLYSLLAGRRVGADGVVYAFEPHVPTAESLLHNVAASGLGDRIEVLTCALHDRDGLFPFNYRGVGAGSSGSQLDGVRDDTGAAFETILREMKMGVTVDGLVERAEILPPDLVKIDVDGNETLILAGMKEVLSGPQRPRAVQVEIVRRQRDSVFATMEELGFELAERHHTIAGKQALTRGADVDAIPHNVIFRPR